MGVADNTSPSLYHEPTPSGKLWAKTKKTPFVPMGILAAVGTIAYSAHSYKHRGNMSTSVFLMHLRVRAQSMIVGAMALGVGYQLYKEYVAKEE